ncbi:MAG: mercuric transport protein MerTP [Flavobacteriaceae bacterium]|nr:mercuric transport protein MerTP [Flavobacteriaceae bacterium]
MNKFSNSAKGKPGKAVGAGLLVALSASLCCITPVLALLSGTSGFASTFSFMEPFRPYLIALTLLILGFAWYLKLKPGTPQEIKCACGDDEKKPFIQTRLFLGIVTVFAVLMLTFPNYAHIFYPSSDRKEVVIVNASDVQTTKFVVEGMTCNGCAAHVENVVNKLTGIVSVDAIYEEGTTEVTFDQSKVSIVQIREAINNTGYQVVGQK